MLRWLTLVILDVLSGITIAGVGLALITLLGRDTVFAGPAIWIAIVVCTAGVMLRPGGALRPGRGRRSTTQSSTRNGATSDER